MAYFLQVGSAGTSASFETGPPRASAFGGFPGFYISRPYN